MISEVKSRIITNTSGNACYHKFNCFEVAVIELFVEIATDESEFARGSILSVPYVQSSHELTESDEYWSKIIFIITIPHTTY